MINEIVFVQYTSFPWKLITVALGTGRVVFLYFGWNQDVERVSTVGYYVIIQPI